MIEKANCIGRVSGDSSSPTTFHLMPSHKAAINHFGVFQIENDEDPRLGRASIYTRKTSKANLLIEEKRAHLQISC